MPAAHFTKCFPITTSAMRGFNLLTTRVAFKFSGMIYNIYIFNKKIKE